MSKVLIKRQPETPNRNYRYIPLSNILNTIVDADDYEKLNAYHWRLYKSSNCFYAARRVRHNGRAVLIKMHRVVAKTLPGYECHHKNHNTLDNRKCNLENLLPKDHAAAHGKGL